MIPLPECRNHFASAGRVLVHEDYNATVELLWTETFRNHENRFVDKSIPQSQPKKRGFVGRYSTESRQFFSRIPFLLTSARQTVSHLFPIGGQIAHKAQSADPSSGVAPEIHNQPCRIPQV